MTDSDEVPSEEIESSMYHLKNNLVNESDSKVMHSFGPSYENSKAESSSYNHEVNHILQAGG